MRQQRAVRRRWGPQDPGPPRRGAWAILLLLRQGREDEAIAARLGITVGTVRGHLSRLRERLDVRSRSRAERLERVL
ncbi:LuxR C-terminal-related transcriptional regulator [Thermogemmatispora sp.]|uniref:LuxR C-terminal-related transcriptional regulator n=1 Tax=Thermogemmatispora sp. TaxID=1968838 RepID=UPI0035E45ED4